MHLVSSFYITLAQARSCSIFIGHIFVEVQRSCFSFSVNPDTNVQVKLQTDTLPNKTVNLYSSAKCPNSSPEHNHPDQLAINCSWFTNESAGIVLHRALFVVEMCFFFDSIWYMANGLPEKQNGRRHLIFFISQRLHTSSINFLSIQSQTGLH